MGILTGLHLLPRAPLMKAALTPDLPSPNPRARNAADATRGQTNYRRTMNEAEVNGWGVRTSSSPPYVSAKETTPSPSRSKNDACLYSSVVAAPCGSPNAAARPTSQGQERTNSASRVAGENRDAQMRSAKQIMTDAPAEAERLTNRTERRREAAKAQPPPLGTPVVAEPCPSPFSGDSLWSLDWTLSRERSS